MLHILGGLNMKGRSLRSVFCISKQLFRVLLLKILFFYPLHLISSQPHLSDSSFYLFEFFEWTACLNEESYPVQSGSISSLKVTRDFTVQHSQERDFGNSQSVATSRAMDSNMPVFSGAESMDLEAKQSEHMSSSLNAPLFVKEADPEAPPLHTSNELNFDGAVANDSESDDNDLYLSDCRILLVGFEASEMRKLVNMVRKGGGSRYMSFNDKLTHIVVGNPTEM